MRLDRSQMCGAHPRTSTWPRLTRPTRDVGKLVLVFSEVHSGGARRRHTRRQSVTAPDAADEWSIKSILGALSTPKGD